MKPNRDATALAARLGAAANTPVPLPSPSPEQTLASVVSMTGAGVSERAVVSTPARKAAKSAKPAAPSQAVTVRMPPDLVNRYVLAAADKTREKGRVVSAQEIMLAQLEKGP